MRNTSTQFWKKYDRMQTNMVKACMPRTAAFALAARNNNPPTPTSALTVAPSR